MIQLKKFEEKSDNLKSVDNLIRQAYNQYKPRIIVLPEVFNCTYGTAHFEKNSEYIPTGTTSVFLANLAKELQIYLVGGSFIEIDQDDKTKLYNTIPVFSPSGELIARHRKVCDIVFFFF